MPIDANIALGVKPMQIESPVNQLANVLQIQGAQQANQMNSLKMDEYNRGVQRTNKLRELLGGLGAGVTDEQRVGALRGGAYFDEADKLEGGILARQKSGAEVAKLGAETKYKELEGNLKRLDVAGQTFGFVLKNPTLENAHAALDYLGENGVYTPEMVAQYKAQTAANPASIPQLAETAFRSVLSAKDQLSKVDTLNAGDRQVTQSVDPVTGQVQQIGAQTINQSAQSKAEIASREREAAAGRAVQREGQELTRQRLDFDKSRPAGAKASGPMSVTLQKELLESDDTVQSSKSVISTLKNALQLNDKAYSGYGAKARATLTSNLGGSEAADATINIDNMMTGQGLEQMKSIFGAAPTEGERQILMDMQASADKTPKQRKDIMERAINAAERRMKYAESKAKSIRDGSYLTTGAPAPQEPAANPQDAQALAWANANPNDPRAAAIKQRLGAK